MREIDTACELASNQPNLAEPPVTRTPAAAAAVELCPRAPRPNPKRKGYQPNLDKFVEAFRKRKSGSSQSSRPCISKTPVLDCQGYDNPGAEGGESDVRIDLETAQTWHYPRKFPFFDAKFSAFLYSRHSKE